MVVDLVVGELDWIHERIAGRFGRAEPRAQGGGSLYPVAAVSSR